MKLDISQFLNAPDSEDALEAYYLVLQDFPYQEAYKAIKVVLSQKRDFPPNAGHIVEEIHKNRAREALGKHVSSTNDYLEHYYTIDSTGSKRYYMRSPRKYRIDTNNGS